METKHERPDWVIGFARPEGTEIKFISGGWYLYERLNVYDPQKKKNRKKSGKLIGRITEDGLLKSRKREKEDYIFKLKENNSDKAEQKINVLDESKNENNETINNSNSNVDIYSPIEQLEFGASKFLYNISVNIIEKLKIFFPLLWKQILALAIIKCKEQCPFKRIEFLYNTSWLSLKLGKLALSKSAISRLLIDIGKDRESIKRYLSSYHPNSGIILFDGHRIISSSKNLSTARLGYDSKQRFMPQINLLYIFDVDDTTRFPIYYKQFCGDVPDITAFSDIVKESGLSNSDITIIADKGFGSLQNFDLINELNLKYIIPLRRGTQYTKDTPNSPSSYESAFVFRERAIYYSEVIVDNKKIFHYYDMKLANEETSSIITRINKKNNENQKKLELEEKRKSKNKGRLSDSDIEKLKPIDVSTILANKKVGTFSIETNDLSLTGIKCYTLYKTRQEIEQSFKSYDITLDSSSSYLRDEYSIEAWLFINHLSLQIFYNVLNKINDLDLSKKYSFDDVIMYLKAVRTCKIQNKFVLTAMTNKTIRCCEELGISLEILDNQEQGVPTGIPAPSDFAPAPSSEAASEPNPEVTPPSPQ